MKVKNSENICLNLISSNKILSDKVKMFKINILSNNDLNRSIRTYHAKKLSEMGYIVTVAPEDESSNNTDLILFTTTNIQDLRLNKNLYSIKSQEKVPLDNISGLLIKALQFSLTSYLSSKGYMKLNDYIHVDSLRSDNPYKEAFSIQATIINKKIAFWIKVKHKFISYLKEQQSNRLGLKVRVLPTWSAGTLCSNPGWKGELSPKDFWSKKHKFNLKNPDGLYVGVKFDSDNPPYSYPIETVFVEFKKGSSLPNFLKIDPDTRVEKVRNFVNNVLNGFKFLNEIHTFFCYNKISDLPFNHFSLANPEITILDEESNEINIQNREVVQELKSGSIPYSAKQTINYIVIGPDNKNIPEFLILVEKAFEQLNLGKMNKLMSPIIIEDSIDSLYESIQEIGFGTDQQVDICLFIKPESYVDGYYESRMVLMSDQTGPKIHTQSIDEKTVNKVIAGNLIPLENIVAQIYIKGSGIGKIPWRLSLPADNGINNSSGGITCYGFFDVSRRADEGTFASVYTALIDPYGRLLYPENFPSSHENLNIETAYTMVLKLIIRSTTKIDDKVNVSRLVFAKDGKITENDENVIRDVLYKGIPDKNKQPLEQVLKTRKNFPEKFTIDFISVNKTPKKEVIQKQGESFKNVPQGTIFTLNDSTALLISVHTKYGTNQPIEIALHGHYDLNTKTEKPTIEQICEEYYRLTFLNWNSLYYKGKLALPQQITQAIGENLTKGVILPRDYTPI